jgi:hypothetical protein
MQKFAELLASNKMNSEPLTRMRRTMLSPISPSICFRPPRSQNSSVRLSAAASVRVSPPLKAMQIVNGAAQAMECRYVTSIGVLRPWSHTEISFWGVIWPRKNLCGTRDPPNSLFLITLRIRLADCIGVPNHRDCFQPAAVRVTLPVSRSG